MSDVIAWLRGEPVHDSSVLSCVGPGLAPGPGAAPIAALAWNAFAFELGRRLLAALSMQPGAAAHVLDAASSGIAAVGSVQELLERTSDPKEGAQAMAMIEATLRPMATLDGSSGAALLLRIFLWGTRRVRRDRRIADALATLAAEACEVHAELAGLGGNDPEAAEEAERAAQLADARSVVSGQGFGP